MGRVRDGINVGKHLHALLAGPAEYLLECIGAFPGRTILPLAAGAVYFDFEKAVP